MERELRDLGKLGFFGLQKSDSDHEKVLEEIDQLQSKTVYEYSSNDCSDACKKRGEKRFLVFKISSLQITVNMLSLVVGGWRHLTKYFIVMMPLVFFSLLFTKMASLFCALRCFGLLFESRLLNFLLE